MPVVDASPLVSWESFYVIVGSSAAALTGLMFVVISLSAERRSSEMPHAVSAFGTPTVVHFCAAFLVSVIVSAPWSGVGAPGALIGAIGLAGIGYMFVVIRRTRRQTVYRPVFEDWVWHTILPSASYITLGVSALALRSGRPSALYAIGAACLLFILIGIHNSWDAVTFNALQVQETAKGEGRPAP